MQPSWPGGTSADPGTRSRRMHHGCRAAHRAPGDRRYRSSPRAPPCLPRRSSGPLPQRPRPRCESVTENPSPVRIETERPRDGTNPAKVTSPAAGAPTPHQSRQRYRCRDAGPRRRDLHPARSHAARPRRQAMTTRALPPASPGTRASARAPAADVARDGLARNCPPRRRRRTRRRRCTRTRRNLHLLFSRRATREGHDSEWVGRRQ